MILIRLLGLLLLATALAGAGPGGFELRGVLFLFATGVMCLLLPRPSRGARDDQLAAWSSELSSTGSQAPPKTSFDGGPKSYFKMSVTAGGTTKAFTVGEPITEADVKALKASLRLGDEPEERA